MDEQLQTKIQSERDNALAELSEVIDEARYKSLGDGRIRNPQSEKIRLKYLRIIIQANAERRKYLADKDLEELKERLERIEEQQ
jgi:F0F1-type ATP synthase membrane subunit b/b'